MITVRQKSRFQFEIAGEGDDRELRALLRRTPMKGAMTLTFEREPSFFAAARVQGAFHQVGVVRDLITQAIIGMGSRSIDEAFQNGRATPLGYLSDLRLEAGFRKGTLVARGYKVFRDLHRDGRAQLYYTVIFSKNQTALQTIAASRAGLPGYYDFGRLHCPGINIARQKPAVPFDGEIKRGSRELLAEIIECLNRNNQRRQFAPLHRIEDFLEGGRWRGFQPADFYVALRGRHVVGVVGKWDQRSFRQTRLIEYGSVLRRLKPLANLVYPLLGRHRLPQPGRTLDFFFASFIAIDDDDLHVFRALLRSLYNDAVGSAFAYFLIGLHERDPLLSVLSDYRLMPFFGQLFCVCFPEDELVMRALDRRCPYIEMATL